MAERPACPGFDQQRAQMSAAPPAFIPLADDELPEITDAGVALTLLMVACLMAERERQALTARIADAIEARDWTAMAALTRRLADVPGAVCRMSDVARSGIDRYEAGLADPTDGPDVNARARRSLSRAANWLDRRFWPMYGTVRTVLPPPSDEPTPAPRAGAVPAKPGACRKRMRKRLNLLDGELARLEGDRRDAAGTARLIMLADRNSHASRCRACATCKLATARLTRDIPGL